MDHIIYDMLKTARSSMNAVSRLKVGTAGGLVGGFSIFLIIFMIDFGLGLQAGSFYKVVGLPVGLGGLPATIFGMISHMLTASLIGAVYFYFSGVHPKLEITSWKKGTISGTVTAVAVYGIFFLPMTMFLIEPSIQLASTDTESMITTLTNVEASQLLNMMDIIVIGALEMHIVFGLIMGIFCGVMMDRIVNEKMFNVSKMIKFVTVSIILATALIGIYYGTVQGMFAAQTEEVTSRLQNLQEGLTYAKFVDLGEKEQKELINKMSPETRRIVIQHAKSFNSQINEGLNTITNGVPPDQVRFLQDSKIDGVKGNQAEGRAMVVTAGDEKYLRFVDFKVTNGIDLHVYLTKGGDISSGINIGKLKATEGDQNYLISGINTKVYNVVIIYDKQFETYYASATLN